MIHTRVITGMVMNDGWHYDQNMPNGGVQRVHSDSYENLVTVDLPNFRIANFIPVGSAQADIDNQICANQPNQCHKTGVSVTSPHPISRNLSDDIIDWSRRIMNEGKAREMVTQPEAEKRAQICIQCPRNTQWLTGCSGCTKSARALLFMIAGDKKLTSSLQQNLHACTSFKHDNATAIWLEKSAITKGIDVPQKCWAL